MSIFYTAFVNKDSAVVEEELNKIMFETISALDENESYYHGLVAGLLSPMKGYRTKSNRERREREKRSVCQARVAQKRGVCRRV